MKSSSLRISIPREKREANPAFCQDKAVGSDKNGSIGAEKMAPARLLPTQKGYLIRRIRLIPIAVFGWAGPSARPPVRREAAKQSG
jgi:hypothetical protein